MKLIVPKQRAISILLTGFILLVSLQHNCLTEASLSDQDLSGPATIKRPHRAWLSTIQNAVYTGKRLYDPVAYDDLEAYATSYRRIARLVAWNRQGAPPPGYGYYPIYVSHCNQRALEHYPFTES